MAFANRGGGDFSMKRWALIGLVMLLALAVSSVSFAGDVQRGRWEGLAIGLGAVTLYNLFEHGTFSPVIPPYRPHRKHVYHPPVVHEPSGHWEIHREWVPEQKERLWVPGHYEDGYWVKGHYEVHVYPGYYVDRRVWVEHQSYRPRSEGRHQRLPWGHGHKIKY